MDQLTPFRPEQPWDAWGGWWWWQPVTWVPQPWIPPPPPFRPKAWPTRLPKVVHVQCRDATASFNTLLPDWCWWGNQVPTRAVVPGMRNGVPCKCFCPPGRCEGKRGVERRFRPHYWRW